ncbi:NFAT activation molecule 1 [Rhinatrema bivittatum]|uniref:NFAT activation molecule 1 n=1 Tax=Rhinatrema bivittatum TaxID=194408 RepID=UPI00112845C9|nr:NFAT activation molecule 1 [Rhinatrema bivittatum]
MISGPTLLQLLLLGGVQCTGAERTSVKQWPPFQVTLAKRSVNIHCTVACVYSPEYASFTLRFYKLDSEGKSVTLDEGVKHITNPPAINTTVEFNYSCSVNPTRDVAIKDTYYCNATWQSETKIGGGIFIHVIDKGYKPPRKDYQSLRYCLIAISSILAVLGCAETVVLLLWKRKGYPLRSQRNSHQKRTCQPEAAPCASSVPEACKDSSLYTSLQPCQPELYDVIEDGSNGQRKEKDPPGPNRRNLEVQNSRRSRAVNGQSGKKKRRKKNKQVVDVMPKPESYSGSNFEGVYENL